MSILFYLKKMLFIMWKIYRKPGLSISNQIYNFKNRTRPPNRPTEEHMFAESEEQRRQTRV